MKEIVLSGMRPTGKLHLGHWAGALSNWVKLQQNYKCFFMVADWHALMSEYKNPSFLKETVIDNVVDWIVYGIDPQESVIFLQSQIKEHLELFLILSFLTPLGRLFRCPTFKEQIRQLKDKEINTYGFLGYPILQCADILLYKANFVPVGEDQLPHLELCREIARRFHFLYKKEIFPEPQALLTKKAKLLGIDGRKMSKSYNNYIALDEEDRIIEEKILSMFTDPERKRKTDKGHPQNCNVFSYYLVFKEELKEEVYQWCSEAKKGCVDCKKSLAQIIKEFIAPKRKKKREFLKKKEKIFDILREGNKKAKEIASFTLEEVKEIIKVNFNL